MPEDKWKSSIHRLGTCSKWANTCKVRERWADKAHWPTQKHPGAKRALVCHQPAAVALLQICLPACIWPLLQNCWWSQTTVHWLKCCISQLNKEPQYSFTWNCVCTWSLLWLNPIKCQHGMHQKDQCSTEHSKVKGKTKKQNKKNPWIWEFKRLYYGFAMQQRVSKWITETANTACRFVAAVWCWAGSQYLTVTSS